MDDTYLVEIRCARTRWQIKETTRVITQKFGIDRYRERHPHVTLYGPFTLQNPGQEPYLLDTIGSIAAPCDPVPFTLDGWEKRQGMHGGVVAFSVRPSPELAGLTAALARALSGFTVSLNVWDQHPENKWFHATIANLLPPNKAEEVIFGLSAQNSLPAVTKRYGQGTGLSRIFRRFFEGIRTFRSRYITRNTPVRPVLLDDTGLRITVMHNDEILGEFDLLKKTWLTRDEIHDPRSWQQTLALFRKHAGFELTCPLVQGSHEIFLIADLHLGHANIIRYCSRPFVHSGVTEMDEVLIANWNYCITPKDRVYFLGDLRYGKDARPDTEYRARLNGKITFISGNHDRSSLAGMVPSAEIRYEGLRFIFVHNPADVPEDFDGWIVHGHHHNNDLYNFPFIDSTKKQVNVSAEVIGYYPITLREISQSIHELEQGRENYRLLRYPHTAPKNPGAGSRTMK